MLTDSTDSLKNHFPLPKRTLTRRPARGREVNAAMTNPIQFDNLVAEMEKASVEIRRLKDVKKLHLIRGSEDTKSVESAISYWETRKREAEDQLRQLR